MATFVLIHGGGDVGWSWHLVADELRRRGHVVVAPDLPSDDDAADLDDYADAVVDAIGDRRDLIVVGHSYGGFTAPLVADRLPVEVLVLVAGMIPAPGETPAEWWEHTGYEAAAEEQARRDGGLTGSDDPFVAYYHDVPRDLAEQAMSRERGESATAYETPWPLAAWPAVPTRFVVCSEDRFLPAAFMRRLVAERLGIVPEEIAAGHCVALSRPQELAELLDGYVPTRGRPRDTTPYDLEVTRTFEVPPERVYQAFADPDQFHRWYGPAGFPVDPETVEIDARVGGRHRFTMVSADDPSLRTEFDGEFVEVVAGRLLSSRGAWQGIPGQVDPWPSNLRVELEADEGRTTLVVREGPHPPGTAELGRQAWASMLDDLESVLDT